MGSIEESIENVKRSWAESPYYHNAEKWTWLFWKQETIFRRYFDRLDVRSCAELACGHGRHSEQLLLSKGDQVKSLYCLDVLQNNVDVTRQRLSGFPMVECALTKGSNFLPIGDNSLTSVFCYDAMVHFSPDIVRSYVLDLVRVLKSGGRALFHHSNLDAPNTGPAYGSNPHARNHMTEVLFGSFIKEAGLTILDSEAINWGSIPNLDRLTLIQKL